MWQDGGVFEITAGDKTLEAGSWGPAPGIADTIVLLHEGLGSLALWKEFPKALAEATGCGVFAYSRAGYGKSDACELPRQVDYMHREALDVLPEVLDVFGFERGVLVGHSDGASIAAIYAGGVQDHRVRGLVLMAPHFFVEPCTKAAANDARDAFENGDLRGKLGFYHRDVDAAFAGWNDAWTSAEFQSWDISDYLAYIRVPVMGIQGLSDPYGTRAQVEILPEHLYSPADVELLEGVGHVPHVEAREQVLGLLSEFSARLGRIEAEVVEIPETA